MAICSDADWEAVLNWPLGRRDELLLSFRQRVFGSQLNNVAACPNCSQQVEWNMDINRMIAGHPVQSRYFPVFTLEKPPYVIWFRLPNSRDFWGERAVTDASRLVRNCIIAAEKKGKPHPADQLPDTIIQLLEKEMEREDPSANLSFSLACPECNHSWSAMLDVMNYVWIEIDVWAKRLLHEVLVLARAFGWSEHDILHMHPRRRQLYLEMLST